MTYQFGKWEGFSYETRENGETEEFYPTEVWDGEMSEKEFFATYLPNKRVVKHTYRYLTYSEDNYESGETVAQCYEIDSDGNATECDMWDDYWN